jgi:transposase
VLSARQAFNEGLSTGLKDPSGKGKRLIVVHIGSEGGFVEGGQYIFESKSTKDYHEEMDGQRFAAWLENVLPLLDLSKGYLAKNPIPYVIDRMVQETGREVLRLPPYHCNLNPIELIWAQVKGYVAANNTTFKLPHVKKLFYDGLLQVTAEKWISCIEHVIKEEENMYRLDDNIENIMEICFMVNTDEDV